MSAVQYTPEAIVHMAKVLYGRESLYNCGIPRPSFEELPPRIQREYQHDARNVLVILCRKLKCGMKGCPVQEEVRHDPHR